MGFDKSPISNTTLAILIGLLIRNTVGVPALFRPGVTFCVKKVLRLGIILLGIRLNLVDVLKISASALPLVVVIVAAALYLVWLFARRLRLPERLGILTAVGTCICGVSAIVATAPYIDATDEEVSYAVANITIFGLLAMFIYPFLAHVLFGGTPLATGLWLGTSIHDTAQVTGAGLMYDAQYPGISPTCGEVAVVTKLARNTLMAAVVPLVSLVYVRHMCTGERKGTGASILRHLPLFVLGFIVIALVRTAGDAMVDGGWPALGIWSPESWAQFTHLIAGWTKNLLPLAMASVGLGTSYQVLKGLGLRPFLLGLMAALFVGVVSALLITTFVSLLAAQGA